MTVNLDKDAYSRSEVQDMLNFIQAAHQDEHKKVVAQMRQLMAYVDEHNMRSGDAAEKKNSLGDDAEKICAELKDMSAHLDKAINAIILQSGKIEDLLKVYQFSEARKVKESIVKICEACNVHDIATQRIGKIIKILNGESDKIADKNNLETGPQLSSQAMSQADIDKLLEG